MGQKGTVVGRRWWAWRSGADVATELVRPLPTVSPALPSWTNTTPLLFARSLQLHVEAYETHEIRQEPLASVAGAPYDVVVDLVGAEPHSWGVLKRSGRMAAVSFDQIVEG